MNRGWPRQKYDSCACPNCKSRSSQVIFSQPELAHDAPGSPLQADGRSKSEDLVCAEMCSEIYHGTQQERQQAFDSIGCHVEVDQATHESNRPKYMLALRTEDPSVLYLVFRGTQMTSLMDWFKNADCQPVQPFDSADPGYKVHCGIWSSIKGAMAGILDSVEGGLSRRSGVSTLVITGHSLGGAYAALARLHICLRERELLQSRRVFANRRLSYRVVTFGAPLVFSVPDGCYDHCARLPAQLHAELRCYVNRCDMVPRLLGRKEASTWLGLLRRNKHSAKEVGLASGSVAAGSLVVASTAATGGVALMLFLAAGAVSLQHGAKVLAVKQVEESVRALETSPEVNSYVCVGRFGFLSGQAVSLCSGREAHDRLGVPEHVSITDTVADHQIVQYVAFFSSAA